MNLIPHYIYNQESKIDVEKPAIRKKTKFEDDNKVRLTRHFETSGGFPVRQHGIKITRLSSFFPFPSRTVGAVTSKNRK